MSAWDPAKRRSQFDKISMTRLVMTTYAAGYQAVQARRRAGPTKNVEIESSWPS